MTFSVPRVVLLTRTKVELLKYLDDDLPNPERKQAKNSKRNKTKTEQNTSLDGE